jgi:flagellar capping protein FliD
MKRSLVVLLSLALGALSAQAAFRLYLQNGKVILLDDQPVIQGDMTYFTKNGVTYYLPASQVDEAKTERENGPALAQPAALQTPAKPPAAKAPVIDEEQLDIIRRRSRLANEAELEAPPAPPSTPQEGEAGPAEPMAPAQARASAGAASQQKRAAVQSKLTDLLARQSMVSQQQNDLRSQISTLTDKYNFSTQQTEQAAIQGQLDSLQRQLDQVNNQAASLNSEIQSTQQELASIPLVVQEGGD